MQKSLQSGDGEDSEEPCSNRYSVNSSSLQNTRPMIELRWDVWPDVRGAAAAAAATDDVVRRKDAVLLCSISTGSQLADVIYLYKFKK